MNCQVNIFNLFLKNDVTVMIDKVKYSFQTLPNLKEGNPTYRHRRVNNIYYKKITEHPINQKSLEIIIFQLLRGERKQSLFNYLLNFLKKCLFLIYINFSFSSKKIQNLLVKIFLKMKNEKFILSNFEFFWGYQPKTNFDKISIYEFKNDLFIIKKILLTFSFEGFNWFLISENSKKSKNFFSPENFYRIILLTIKFSKKLTNSFKKSILYLVCTKKQGFRYSGGENFTFNKNNIKIKKNSSGKNESNDFTCNLFFLIFWKNEWNLELLRYLKNLKVSRWIFQKIIKLNGNLSFQSYNLKKRPISIEKPNFFFSFIKKIRTLIQEFPHSIILKARFLCQLISKQEFRKNSFNLLLWIKDVQDSSHFNHLSFLLLLTDFILSGPKTKNIVFSMISLTQKNLLILKDLIKIPQKAEKYINKEFLRKTIIPISSLPFFIGNGLLDLGRKYILKSTLYSNVRCQEIFFKYLIESESKTLFFYLLSKISRFPKVFKGKNFDIKNIEKILEQNGRWGLLYIVIYENFQKKKTINFEEKTKI